MIKAMNIPVRIFEDDKELCHAKYAALDLILNEAKFLTNKAIRFCIAYDLSVDKKKIFSPIDKNGEIGNLSTVIYQQLSKDRKYLPSGSLATLSNNYALKMFKSHNKDAWAGIKSLPTCRNPILPIRKTGTKIVEYNSDKDNQYIIIPSGFIQNWFNNDLSTKIGYNQEIKKENQALCIISTLSWKDDGARAILSRIVSGEYELKDSMLRKIWKYDKDTGKKKPHYFFSLIYDNKSNGIVLDKSNICGIDLGVKIPVYCAFNNGPQRFAFGSFEDVWAGRSKFRSQRRRKQKRFGMVSKSVIWEESDKEKNWVNNYYHTATRAVIKFCLKYNCGVIHAENLSNLRTKELNSDNSERKRLIWVPSKFITMLSYKAKECGIDVVLINPKNTSRRCSSCGHISKENRLTQERFLCIHCGEEMNADYNAAKNISLASGSVIQNGYVIEN